MSKESNTEFYDAKVGDKVFDLYTDLYGKIISIAKEKGMELPLEVEFYDLKGESEGIEYYDFEGYNDFRFRSLYWDKPLIIPPSKEGSANAISKREKVIIEVLGGVAYIKEQTTNVDVEIIDYDNLKHE